MFTGRSAARRRRAEPLEAALSRRGRSNGAGGHGVASLRWRVAGLTAQTYGASVAIDRDQRAHARDVAAAKRDAEAAVRDGLADEHVVSEREVAARAAARTDREAPLLDRLASAETASLRRERATLPSGAASSRFRY